MHPSANGIVIFETLSLIGTICSCLGLGYILGRETTRKKLFRSFTQLSSEDDGRTGRVIDLWGHHVFGTQFTIVLEADSFQPKVVVVARRNVALLDLRVGSRIIISGGQIKNDVMRDAS
jgi:hypothetical protein